MSAFPRPTLHKVKHELIVYTETKCMEDQLVSYVVNNPNMTFDIHGKSTTLFVKLTEVDSEHSKCTFEIESCLSWLDISIFFSEFIAYMEKEELDIPLKTLNHYYVKY